MAIHTTHAYLLSYDIADPVRLGRVHRTVRRYGVPVQYSVFLVPADMFRLEDLVQALQDIIDPHADDIRIYPLPKRLDVETYGRQVLPSGVLLLGEDGGEPYVEALCAQVGESWSDSDA